MDAVDHNAVISNLHAECEPGGAQRVPARAIAKV
jgi:hypothetical protein